MRAYFPGHQSQYNSSILYNVRLLCLEPKSMLIPKFCKDDTEYCGGCDYTFNVTYTRYVLPPILLVSCLYLHG